MKMFSTYDLASRFARAERHEGNHNRAEDVENAAVEDIEESEDDDDDRIEEIGNKDQNAHRGGPEDLQ